MKTLLNSLLLCCWLGLAACSSETPDDGDDAYEDEDYSESAAEEPADPPKALITLEGETIEVTGEGFCRRVGSTQTFGPEGRFEIGIIANHQRIFTAKF